MKLFTIPLFVVMIFAQLFVPSKMVFDYEQILTEGALFQFKLEPIDPNDPFRGKYIILNFEADKFKVQEELNDWGYGDPLFVEIEKDSAGFVQITGVTKQAPDMGIDFVKAEIRYINRHRSKKDGMSEIVVEYPFTTFYMEESKAPVAESKFIEMRRDSSAVAWANVKILNGKAVIEDVLINGKSVSRIIEE